MRIAETRADLPAIGSRTLLFALAWWVLTAGDPSSWWFGAPAVVLAALVSMRLVPPLRFSWFGLLGFVPFFLLHSLKGGADVAWRALQPRMPIAPDLVEYRLRLPPGLPQVVLLGIVNLLPGTLSAQLESETLKVHVLDRRKAFAAEIEAVERRVARMFRVAKQSA